MTCTQASERDPPRPPLRKGGSKRVAPAAVARSPDLAIEGSVARNDRAMQEGMSRINIEPSIRSVGWERVWDESGA